MLGRHLNDEDSQADNTAMQNRVKRLIEPLIPRFRGACESGR